MAKMLHNCADRYAHLPNGRAGGGGQITALAEKWPKMAHFSRKIFKIKDLRGVEKMTLAFLNALEEREITITHTSAPNFEKNLLIKSCARTRPFIR